MGVAGGAVSCSILYYLPGIFANIERSFHQSKVLLPTVQIREFPWSYRLLDLSTSSSIACITGSPTVATLCVSRISLLLLILLGEEGRLGEALWVVQSTMFITPETNRVFLQKEAGEHLSFRMAESSLLLFTSEDHLWLKALLSRKSRRAIRFSCERLPRGVLIVDRVLELRIVMCLYP